MICLKQHAKSWCSFHQAFPLGILLEPKWCNHIVALIRLQFTLFEKSDFRIVDKMSIAAPAFPIHMLASISVDDGF